jgi:hypothetical protein
MQEDTLHILIVMRVAMSMIMPFMPVIMSMTMVRVSECSETHDVNEEAQCTDDKKLVQAMQFGAFH